MAKGLMVLTGEVGTGKTTALRWIIGRLDRGVRAAYLFNPHLSIEEFYHQLTEGLLLSAWTNKADLLSQMQALLKIRHSRGLRTIIIVDEAHELSDELLEEIRLLLNFESDSAKYLQVILTGQPELRERLRQPNLRQLKQRIAVRCVVPSIQDVGETEHYITERLRIAGAQETKIFSQAAIDRIFHYSEGIPRQVNNLCDNAMIAAYGAGTRNIDKAIIEEIAENLDMLQGDIYASDGEKETKPSLNLFDTIGSKDRLQVVDDGFVERENVPSRPRDNRKKAI
ncbi:MAG: ExeA family protein [Pyrinomonadaceae bacterium]